ncbi:MAG: DUF445 domain-containing protein [Sulfobacillus thermosulfidooxidans]|uniref:DUF445 domain-containing protein n=1 Tax=Sulfobacillus thermotolerans TaxID=338644 RepID=A0ABM6RTH0_9FIRM|nr:DUF445 domain-containing protein [Sulfobacillus sp. hq2]AUW94661.1 hypothetical protein BXT84_12490 [Sulfobacillus thermotolerans]POB11471.1 DUF445 domain-containing protein [Sulfobacillus sp. hq2]PSR38045.1 MAG: DUF445 domain-containing protein [Sulfobacillus thermosulfidooxidans]
MQRRWANMTLGIALVLFLTALVFHRHVWAPYLESMALAGLAGGVADWYAVTALFRHPLGIKWLPHTSIISANRDRIIDALATLVETELLSVGFIESNIEKLQISQQLVHLLQSSPSPEIQRVLTDAANQLLDLIPEEKIASSLEHFTTERAHTVNLSDYIVSLVKWLIQSENDRAFFKFLAHHVVQVLNSVEFTEDMENRLKDMLEKYTKTTTQKLVLGLLESLGTVDYKDLSVTVKTQLIDWLQSDKAFEQFELALVRIMMTVRDDTGLRDRIEAAKDDLVSHIPWERAVARVMVELRTQLNRESLWGGISDVMTDMADSLRTHPEQQEMLEGLIKRTTVSLLRRYHPVIGRLVRDNLRHMDEHEWIDKLEWYVGRDLQWIRVNGALVGGLVGLLLAVVIHFL